MQASSISPYEGLKPDDRKKWIMIYPAYINSKKTIQEGRRIPKTKAADNPTCAEMKDVCASQGLAVDVEMDHHYPREMVRDPMHSGRIRVQLYNQDGSPCSEKFSTRKQLMFFIGEMVPKLKTRQSKSAASEGSGSSQSASGGATSKKKKGKKK